MNLTSDTKRPPQRLWHLVLPTGQGRHCLAALPINACDSLPDVALRINKLVREKEPRRLSSLFRSRARVVRLAKPSQLRFEDLHHRGDVAAFNNETYEAISYHDHDEDTTLSNALNHPAQACATFDVVDWYAQQLSSELVTPEQRSTLKEGSMTTVTSAAEVEMKALMVSEEVDATLAVLGIVLLMLTCAVMALLAVGLTSKHWALDVQGGFAAAEVTIAYASFVMNLYRATMQ